MNEPSKKKTAVWKVGLTIFLFGGILFTLASISLGTAAVSATKKRMTVSESIRPGELVTFDSVAVDAGKRVRVVFHAVVEIPESEYEDDSEIVSYRVPMTFKITDDAGLELDRGATPLTGSSMLYDVEASLGKPSESEVKCDTKSATFDAPNSGIIKIEVRVRATSESDAPVTTAHLEVFDQIPSGAAAFGIGGVVLMGFAPLVGFAGYVTLSIGIVSARMRCARERGEERIDSLQLVALVWLFVAGFGVLIGLIPFFGWVNWMGIPISAFGLVFGIVAVASSKDENKTDGLVALIGCLVAMGVGMVRLLLGFGFF